MLRRSLPPGFIVPARPVQRDNPPAGPAWVHEIKRDGYRLVVRRDGALVRLWTRNAIDYTHRLVSIAVVAGKLKARSFTIDGEAVVIGFDGLSQFDALRSREGARSAALFAFDLIELDGADLRSQPLLDRKAALARLLRGIKAGILLNEHIVENGALVFEHVCRLGADRVEEGGRALSIRLANWNHNARHRALAAETTQDGQMPVN
jgi:bifunctional non-homologous end joining protein LigD